LNISIYVIPNGGCGPSIIIDECGICGGNGSSCTCLDDSYEYLGYNETEIEKSIILYDLELTVASLEKLYTDLGTVINLLANSNSTESILDYLLALQNYDLECLDGFCLDLLNLFDNLGLHK